MDIKIKSCLGYLFSYGFVVLLPFVINYLKHKYTTIELMGRQFDTMVTFFPAYVILALIVIYIVSDKRGPPKKD